MTSYKINDERKPVGVCQLFLTIAQMCLLNTLAMFMNDCMGRNLALAG